ncbi:DnaJ domain-containing protein [Phytoactinopolyspora limicola]|uniref:DnaJ domain-containing protein n=1 Tax=Phytoactinopolyspora limicola TaxID=2715536 RepID=UPI0014094605|nr:DnaJ domain-containing protein [Phytoactinopolyspora limicola]
MATDLDELGGRDPHVVLGVHPGADEEQVNRAFRRHAMHGGHPDTGGDAPTFRRLTRAKDILLDAERLAAYNAARRATGADTSGPSPTSGAATHHPTGSEPDGHQSGASGAEPSRAEAQRPASAPMPPKMHPLAIATLVLALLGPLAWPVAIVVGHLAWWRIRRTGRGGQTLVSVALALLYVLSFLTLPRVLVAVVAMFT